MKKFTLGDAMSALDRAVEERGRDYRYPMDKRSLVDKGSDGCHYSDHDGTPLCIVGLALHYLDPELVPTVNCIASASAVISDLSDRFEPDDLYAIRKAYAAAQSDQDTGAHWGYAVERAHQVANRILSDREER